MRIDINLASEPFRRDRPLLLASVALSVVLIGLLGLLISIEVSERREMAETRAAIGRLEARRAQLSAEQARLDSLVRQPQNAEVMDRALFLNLLIARKGVSWTRIFADLEQVMPHNVRLFSVRPQAGERNEIVLDMLVGSQAGEPVIQFLRNLEASALFSQPSVLSSLPPSQSEPLLRYRITVNYAQKL